MDILSPDELQIFVAKSELAPQYKGVIDRDSTNEILDRRLKEHQDVEPAKVEPAKPAKPAKNEPGMIAEISRNTMVLQSGRTAIRELTRGLLGVLGIKAGR